jgi:hypothetical protein
MPLLFRDLDKFNVGSYMEGSILHEQTYLFALLCLLSIISGPLVLVFLPWKKSEFSIRSGGFPTLRLYRVIMYSDLFVYLVRFIVVVASTNKSPIANVSILTSAIQCFLTAMHIYIKLGAMSIQQYDAEIPRERNDVKNDLESPVVAIRVNHSDSSVPMAEVVVDIDRYAQDLDTCRRSLTELRVANRVSVSKQQRDSTSKAPNTQTSTNTDYLDRYMEALHNEPNALNSNKPVDHVPLFQIKQRLQTLTDAMNRGEVFDESEFNYLLRSMDANEEYIQEQKEKERLWREKISSYAQECLIQQRRFIPPDIFVSTQTQLVQEKGIPAALAKRLMQKKCLWLIRLSEENISKLHFAELQGKYSVESNNLDIVETLALYACVPVKFPHDGNGKKALWRKSLEDSAKKLMASKENNTLSASMLRNPAYKNVTGSFTSDELYVPASDDAEFRPVSGRKEESSNPMHDTSFQYEEFPRMKK